MEKFNWTREDTCLLIENFEFYPELWKVPIANASQTETQHSSIDRENIIQESPKIEQNGSKKAVKRKSKETEDDATLAKAIKVMERPVDDF
ncbi:unnamed protein product [Acanthoscelides obtectus]|uniref:Uncharacterized protein n=1 Tax=Acanthoscelides obtectus TaxID=200917 RepID=A0A9P0NUT5_ACAOB|nr:unnamed protein product [Acanthoscelides obtectus]CAK1658029.1 hypothetical protein AOBTE_LOCUS20661 [Acanthoscelides obtectus]